LRLNLAGSIWRLYDHHIGMLYGTGRGSLISGMMAGSGMGIVMIPFFIVLLMALAPAVFGAASWCRNRSNQTTDVTEALEILKRRYPTDRSTKPNTRPSPGICKPKRVLICYITPTKIPYLNDFDFIRSCKSVIANDKQ